MGLGQTLRGLKQASGFITQMTTGSLAAFGGLGLAADSLVHEAPPDVAEKDRFKFQNKTQEYSWWGMRTGFVWSSASTTLLCHNNFRNPLLTLTNGLLTVFVPVFDTNPGFGLWSASLAYALPGWPFQNGRLPEGTPNPIHPLDISSRKTWTGRLTEMVRQISKVQGQMFRGFFNPRKWKPGLQYVLHRKPGYSFYTASLATIPLFVGGLALAGTSLYGRMAHGNEDKVADANAIGHGILKWGFRADAIAIGLIGLEEMRTLRLTGICKVLGGAIILAGSEFMDHPFGRGMHSLGTGLVYYSFGLYPAAVPALLLRRPGFARLVGGAAAA